MIEEHDKSIEDFTIVIKKNPKNAHAHFRRAFSYKAIKVWDNNILTVYIEIFWSCWWFWKGKGIRSNESKNDS